MVRVHLAEDGTIQPSGSFEFGQCWWTIDGQAFPSHGWTDDVPGGAAQAIRAAKEVLVCSGPPRHWPTSTQHKIHYRQSCASFRA